MTAPAIFETLRNAGLSLSLTAEYGVKVTPASKLTDDLRSLIRAHKAELVDWLEAANDPALDPDRDCWPHSSAMNTAEIETFTARVLLFARRGLDATQAEAVADRFVTRDRYEDDRRSCVECGNLTSGRRCAAWQQAQIRSAFVGDLLTLLQRCPAYTGTRPTPGGFD